METLRWPNNYEFFFKRGRESMLIRRWLNENMIGSEGPEVPSNRQMVRYERIYIYIYHVMDKELPPHWRECDESKKIK